MRTGANPAKAGLPAYQPQRLGIATIVYIPSREGYFKNSLEILNYMLSSLRPATSQPFDLLVFDNGSCTEVVSKLRSLYEQKQIDWLVTSNYNLGKAGAWNWIFSAMPNELICYADSDVLFRPGWLEASLKVLEAFPQAGMVSAQPNFYDVMRGEGKAHLELQKDERYTFNDYWPAKEIIDEFCRGIGATEEIAEPFYHNPLPSVTNRELGAAAVIGASHMQFVIPRQVAHRVVPLPATMGLRRAETMSLDYKIDELGCLHLSTQQAHVFHMGNTLSERLLQEINEVINIPANLPEVVKGPSLRRSGWQRLAVSLIRHPRFNRYFSRLYNFLFQALHAEK